MNQILSVESENKKNNKRNGTIEIDKILKFFVIAIIIFSITLIGMGVVGISKNAELSKNVKSTVPQISVGTTDSEDKITLKVMHDKIIKEIVYSWNGENEQKIEGENSTNIEKTIKVPGGTNTLTVIATDVNGQTSEVYKKEFRNGGIKISFESVEEKAKIVVESEKKISYITYRWDEEEEKKVEVNSVKFAKDVETPKGTHTLTVVAVDEENNTETATKRVVGTTKPTIEVSVENKAYYVIKVKDENALTKVEITTEDGTETKETTEKEFEYKVQLKNGSDNKMVIRAYNSNSDKSMAEKKVKCKLD